MKNERINYLAVGAFVLAMFAVLLVVLYRLTGARGATDTYYAYFDNISGITRSSPVSYEGFPVGHIAAIDATQDNGKTGYKVTLEIQQGWKVPQDSTARITAFSLLSEFVIDVREGASTTLLKPGDTLQGVQGADFYSALNSVASDVSDLTTHGAKPLLDKLNRHVDSLGAKLEKNVPVLLADLKTLLGKLDDNADALQQMLSKDNRAHVDHTLSNADVASGKLLQLATDVNTTRVHLDKLIDDTGTLMDESQPDLRASVVHLREALELVSENIDAILRNMEGTSRNMYELSRQLRQNPGLLLNVTPPRDAGGTSTPREP